MKALQKYAGPLEELSAPEQFLLIMSSVPRLNEKIHLLMLTHQFEVPSAIAALHLCCLCSQQHHMQGNTGCCFVDLHSIQ